MTTALTTNTANQMDINIEPIRLMTGQCVMVSIRRITELAIFVDIIGYEGEGIILFSELNRRRMDKVGRTLHLGQRFVAKVINAERLTLSKLRVSPIEAAATELEYANMNH
jgi:translation initiation factor 2 alpha subunit (eIF-2alpha)